MIFRCHFEGFSWKFWCNFSSFVFTPLGSRSVRTFLGSRMWIRIRIIIDADPQHWNFWLVLCAHDNNCDSATIPGGQKVVALSLIVLILTRVTFSRRNSQQIKLRINIVNVFICHDTYSPYSLHSPIPHICCLKWAMNRTHIYS